MENDRFKAFVMRAAQLRDYGAPFSDAIQIALSEAHGLYKSEEFHSGSGLRGTASSEDEAD